MLNEHERLQAEANGWIVCHVYDLQTKRVTVQVLPHEQCEVKSAELLMRVVTMRAQAGDVLATRILKVVMDSLQPTETKPKRKKK